MSQKSLRVLILASCAALAAPVMGAQILGYGFNSVTGTTTPADGSASATAPAMNIVSPAIIGAAGSGVTGASEDRALDNRAATAMGGTTNSSGGRATAAADHEAVDGLLKFTISGWFKTDTTAPIGGNAAIYYNRSGVAGVAVYGDPNTPGKLVLAVDNNSNSSSGFSATQQWVNFAVTFDGTILQPGPNVFFYAGGIGQPLTLVGSGTNTNGSGNDPADNETAPLSIGSRVLFGTTDADPFDGLLDNIRVFDEIVPLATLDSFRAADSVVPEPASLTAIGAIAVLALRRRK